MRLAKVKTDKSDTKAICEYALINEVPIYNDLPDIQSECLQLFRLLDTYLKTTYGNQEQDTRRSCFGCTLQIRSAFFNAQQETAR